MKKFLAIALSLMLVLGLFAACGNADNDADMIACAGLKTAVANASASCRNAAEIILPSNDNDGVARLIERIIKKESPTLFH